MLGDCQILPKFVWRLISTHCRHSISNLWFPSYLKLSACALEYLKCDLFTARVGLMHIGVFILLLLSGERNFGVRLNKPYTASIPMDIPVFTGTHADLLVIVFHKIITTGHARLQPLFDCLLTILVNGMLSCYPPL